MTPPAGLAGDDRARLAELAPVMRRAADLDPSSLARLRLTPASGSVFARLPFGVLVSRTVDAAARPEPLDRTVSATQALDWLEGTRPDPPESRDVDWRGGVPPATGWRRIEVVPDHVVRGLVRSGATALQDAAAREGVPGAQPRAEVADALLDSIVLTVSDDTGAEATVTLRTLSALTRMGFLPRGGAAAVDVAGRWTRVAAGYGSVLVERPGAGLALV